MALFGNKHSKPDASPLLAPEPEGPEEVSDKFQRLKDGRSGAAKRKLLEKSGLEAYSPVRRFLIVSVVAAELTLMGLNVLTDVNLPAGWLLGLAVPLLALLTHRGKKDAPTDTQPPQTE